MATLFERIAGLGLETQKLPIHIFMGVLHELRDGRATGAQAKAVLGLDAEQAKQAGWLRDAINNCPDRNKMLRVIKDHFYMAEWPGTRQYFGDEASFWAKLDDVITSEGGTPTARN